jgi:hypothetical protein
MEIDFKQKWTSLCEDHKIRKYIGFIALVLIAFFLSLNNDVVSNFMNHAGPLALGVALTFLSITLWLLASIVVLKALFEVGAILSLMLFIAQSFCAVPDLPQMNQGALQSLFVMATAFVLIRFFNSIWVQLYGDEKAKPEPTTGLFNDLKNKTPWFIPILNAVFIGIMLWQLYLVFEPIISNTCLIA